MQESEIVDAVHDFVHREFGRGASKTFCTECARWDLRARADLIFVQSRSDVIHAVEAKRTLEGAFDAIAQVARYPANYRWIALPDEDYVSGAGLLKTCSERGIGVLVVHDRRRKPVEVKRRPVYEPGNYLDKWPRLSREWYS